MKALTLLFLASIAFAQTGQPNVTNAQLTTKAFSGDLDTQLRSSSPAWFGYAIKTARTDNQSCCWNSSNGSGCWLEGSGSGRVVSGSNNSAVQLEGTDVAAVLFRLSNNGVDKIRVYSLSCPLDAGGLPFVWLTGVPADASLHYLQKLTANGSDRLANGAIFAIAEHADPAGVNLLIQLAKSNPSARVREQALFWLAQKAGRQASATIIGAIENDPDTQVKKRAVFALSQLPKDEAIPKLIEVARTQKNPEVRKQVFFWLGQSHDPRALAFLEEVLTK